MKNNYTKRGFTLLELLVVVLIIAVLAAVALPQYNKAAAKSRVMQALPFVNAVYDAQKLYFLEHGVYATRLNQLSIDAVCPEGWTCSINENNRLPRARAYNVTFRTDVYKYYAPYTIGGVEMEGIAYCGAYANDTRTRNICKTFGPLLTSADNFYRYQIL